MKTGSILAFAIPLLSPTGGNTCCVEKKKIIQGNNQHTNKQNLFKYKVNFERYNLNELPKLFKNQGFFIHIVMLSLFKSVAKTTILYA